MRGTPLDIFGYHKDRKEERALIAEYESDIEFVLKNVNEGNYELCAELLALPDMIRGYGPVKEGFIKQARALREKLHTQIQTPHANGNGAENQADKQAA